MPRGGQGTRDHGNRSHQSITAPSSASYASGFFQSCPSLPAKAFRSHLRRPARGPGERGHGTAGHIGAFLSPIILPYLLKDQHRPEDWALPLFVAGALYLAGAFCWLIVDPNKPVIEAGEASG